MHAYAHDFSSLSLFDNLNFPYPSSSYDDDHEFPNSFDDGLSLPNDTVSVHCHDGTSPLPFGMDWSPPPRYWNGRNTVWPHHPHTTDAWSFSVTLPSWLTVPQSNPSSDPVVFYRVQVGIRSPEAITTTRIILHRFSDFLNLFTDLKKEFSMKSLPPPPPRKILRIKSHTLLEERRCLLEDWMEKLLSDIAVSRSAPVAIFLELEAAASIS